ncbi:MAG: PTS sugar transporter subunit IIA [Candidatus Omnitrophota bacterium]
MDPDRVMTTKELSNYIKLNEKTIIKMAQNKELPGVKVGNQWRFHIEAVDQYLQRDIVENTPSEELNMIIRTTDQIVPLSRLVDKSLIELDLEARNAKEVLRKLADIADKAGMVADKNKLINELEKREKMLSTAVGKGIAIPHPRYPSTELFTKPNIIIARSKNGVDFEAPDKKKVHLFFMTCAPDVFSHLRLLAKTAKVLQAETAIKKFMDASDNEEIIRILLELERNNIFPG